MIPSIQDAATGTRRTAQEALQLLRQHYGGGNLQYALLQHKHLSTTYCNTIARIPSFVQVWSSLAQTLCDTTGYPLSYATLSLDVVNMLPPQFQERRNKVVNDMSNPALFTRYTFDILLQEITNQANGITINQEISQLMKNPHTSPKPRAQCGNPKCPMPIGHTTATCWHEGGGDPRRKERYQEKQKAKQTAKANYAGVESTDAAVPDPPDDSFDTYTTNCNDSADNNKDIFLSYFAGTYESILPTANALIDLKDNDP